MKMFLSDRWCSCYTCLPRTAPVAAQTGRKTAAPGTGTGAPQMDQRLLANTWPKTSSRDLFVRKLEFQGVSGQNRGLKCN